MNATTGSRARAAARGVTPLWGWVSIAACAIGALATAGGAHAQDGPPVEPHPAGPEAPVEPAPAPDAQPEASPVYRLPWTAGEGFICVQGNHGVVSHHGRQAYAFDFAMPIGTIVRAARAGVVISVVDHHTRAGTSAPNNKVGVDHGDGTTGWYLHLRQGGARVAVGDRVERGAILAESGNVGRSLMPHLHFHVTGPDGQTILIRFDEVPGDGVPRTLASYTSRNEAAE